MDASFTRTILYELNLGERPVEDGKEHLVWWNKRWMIARWREEQGGFTIGKQLLIINIWTDLPRVPRT